MGPAGPMTTNRRVAHDLYSFKLIVYSMCEAEVGLFVKLLILQHILSLYMQASNSSI